MTETLHEPPPGGALAVANPAASDGRAQILFVDDDENFRSTMALELEERGFVVRTLPDAKSFLLVVKEAQEADIVLLDWHMPRTSGIELLKAIRNYGINIPVVFLTARNVIPYESEAFDKGAADFVCKSKGVDILVMRLKIAVAAYNAPHKLVQGELAFSPRRSRAEWQGQDLDLTVGEYKVLELLARNSGNYQTYRDIYDVLRAPDFSSGHGREGGYRANVRSLIRRLRGKFRTLDCEFSKIESYVSFGYRWTDESRLAANAA